MTSKYVNKTNTKFLKSRKTSEWKIDLIKSNFIQNNIVSPCTMWDKKNYLRKCLGSNLESGWKEISSFEFKMQNYLLVLSRKYQLHRHILGVLKQTTALDRLFLTHTGCLNSEWGFYSDYGDDTITS